MEIKTVYAVYFSATGRTRKVVTTLANAIAQTLELPLETVDFTLPAAREETYAFTDKDLVIFGTPTYAGKVPNKLLPFVQTGFAGNGALAVPVVTFGNRSFDNSLAELCASLENAGFHTIAAGAFACQHAFSDTLAAGRPDREDMTVLAQLGAAVVTKLGKMTEIPAPVQVDGDADAPYYRRTGRRAEKLPQGQAADRPEQMHRLRRVRGALPDGQHQPRGPRRGHGRVHQVPFLRAELPDGREVFRRRGVPLPQGDA